MLPRVERAERAIVGEMLTNELPQETLMRSRLLAIGDGVRFAAEPIAKRSPSVTGECATPAREMRAASAESAASRMAEHRRQVYGNRAVTFRARVDRRCHAKLEENPPACGERAVTRAIARRSRKLVERASNSVEQTRIGSVVAEPERELGDCASASEALEMRSERCTLARRVEGAQGVELATRFAVKLRGSLRKKIEGRAEAAARRARATGEC